MCMCTFPCVHMHMLMQNYAFDFRIKEVELFLSEKSFVAVA